ncbi:hypothetical protein HBA55_30170 [Pseudomaricurvus alkylphenolicus]|jgi:hypothetical protein|uniref:hypothetical protein n=1 Tax=Pseudomaricurvus alkylphenolicus TaxID=1306991 RepID=UPI00141FB774|nr:hypothetical protein [Pseudomaricurvus alkylphenolicus]NIB43907.1 hypothetical protein [Pseudomaricurvus alkylphenolicus]
MTESIDNQLQTQIDGQLMEQGAFTPLDLLLSSGRLTYIDYEQWRQGNQPYLDETLLGSPKRIRQQLDAAVAYAKQIGLVEDEQEFTCWDNTGSKLRLSADDEMHHLLSLRFVSVQNEPQMDMFFDNPVVVLVNDIVAALVSRSLADAERALDNLYQQSPNHADLAMFDQMVSALGRSQGPCGDTQAELSSVQELSGHAKRLLSAQYREYLIPLWRYLAKALEGVAFDPEQPQHHSSYVLARAEDWPGVSHAVNQSPLWQQQPVLCLRLAESGLRRQQRIEAITAWCYLCWLHPQVAEESLNEGGQGDRNVSDLWHRFLDLEDTLELDEPLEIGVFPAWLLLAEPGLAQSLPEKLPLREDRAAQLFGVCHRLVKARLAADGDREMGLRGELQQLEPALVDFLKSRV